MDRRQAMVLGALMGATALLGACGGGGGGSTSGGATGAAPAPGAPGAPGASPPLSSNIACWGDSLTPAFALNLQVLVPDRTVFDGGFLGQTSKVILQQQVADASMTTWINIFWTGHNNITDPEGIKADIAAGIAHLVPGNRRFIVLALLNNAVTAPKGTDAYLRVLNLDSDLAALYPDNYIDVRSLLVAAYDPNNPQDVADHANDVVPSSLRYDDIHLRNEASVIVAQRVKQFIDAKGW
jgi:hypothetical protein